MPTFSNRSFAAGELAPALYARADAIRYQTGLRTCRNFTIMRHGGATTRPGTEYISQTFDFNKKVRLIPFIFNRDQTYVLEFSDTTMRVIKDGAHVLNTAVNISNISSGDPAVVTATAHGFSNGDFVFITGVQGMTEINNQIYKASNVTANTMELTYTLDNSDVDVPGLGWGGYSSGGTVANFYRLATPYDDDDLFDINFTQSADVMTLVHPDYQPRELSRLADNNWTLSTAAFNPQITAPVDTFFGISSYHNLDAKTVIKAPSASTVRYIVTSIDEDTGEESLASTEFGYNLDAADSDHVVASVAYAAGTQTIANSNYTSGRRITVTAASGANISGANFIITGLDFRGRKITDVITGPNTGAGAAATVTGTKFFEIVQSVHTVTVSGSPSGNFTMGIAEETDDAPVSVSWAAVTGASAYNIYRRGNSSFGLVGTMVTDFAVPIFKDDKLTPDFDFQPPNWEDPFDTASDYPSTVSYFQQRRVFANTDNNPEKVWASQIGNFYNFGVNAPPSDDDAVIFQMVGNQVNAVRHVLSLNRLIIFTQGGEWVASTEVLTPTQINLVQHTYNGASKVRPLVVDGDALYIQDRGSIVRNLRYQFDVDGYRGSDLTIFSAHLVDGFTITDWAYQQTPHSNVWMVRSDGTLIGMTYVVEQDIIGWHRHDFSGGTVESVAVVPEGDEDFLYLVLVRTASGNTVRWIERMSSREVSDVEDYNFCDASLLYDGQNATSTTITVTGTTYVSTETVTMTASAATFTSRDVGKEVHLTDSLGNIVRISIDAFTSSTVVTGKPNKTVPALLQNMATTNWGLAVKTVIGLWHLNGRNVSAFGDGFVAASPNNPDYTTVTVSNGSATFDEHYVNLRVGLPIIADLETLDIDIANAETMADKDKTITKVSMHVEDSRGIWVGNEAPSGANATDGLYELKIRDEEGYDAAVGLATGVVDVRIRPEWNSHGRVFVRQVDPVPLTVLSVLPRGLFPIRGGR